MTLHVLIHLICQHVDNDFTDRAHSDYISFAATKWAQLFGIESDG